MYIARDKDGQLYLFEHRPIKIKGAYFMSEKGNCMRLKQSEYPCVTFDNSTLKCKLDFEL